jgi:outer membrane protein OmpA-like peptidoglycan-associated protein
MMTSDSIQTADSLAAVAETARVQLALARAARLARAGRYDDADAALWEVRKDAPSPAVLDLMACIRAQQGRFGEAESLWREALTADPGNTAYRAGLDRLERLQRGRTGLRLAAILVSAGLIAVALVVSGRSLARALDRAASAAASSATPITPPASGNANSAQTSGLRGAMGATGATAATGTTGTTGATPPSSSASAAAAPQPPDLQRSIPGTLVATRGSELVVGFTSGLFVRGTHFAPDARSRLRALGAALAAQGHAIDTTIVGFTDDLPVPATASVRHRDNAALGLARARAVFDVLRADAGLEASRVSLKTASDGEPMVTPRKQRQDRRTVELRIAHATR